MANNDEKNILVDRGLPMDPSEGSNHNPNGGYGMDRPGPGVIKVWPGTSHGGPPPGWSPTGPNTNKPDRPKQDAEAKQKEINERNEAALREREREKNARDEAARQREINAREQAVQLAASADAAARKQSQVTAGLQAQTTIKAITAAPVVSPATEGLAKILADSLSQAIKTVSLAKVISPQMLIVAAGVAVPSDLGDGELPASVVTTTLSQLNLAPHLDLNHLANTNAQADISHRAVLNRADVSKPEWASTGGGALSPSVRVRNVRYNAENNTYEFVRDGDSQPALIWTPVVNPGNSSTSTSPTPPERTNPAGFPALPVLPELETYPEDVGDEPDDYILIFPIDSGWENQYVMFRDPRDIRGSASGYGEPVMGDWLNAETSSKGSPIPSRIADQLRGRNFSSFGKQREAIWKAVANDPELAKSFDAIDLAEIKRGYAPFAPPAERRGSRVKYEIHHLQTIKNGGEVYDMDNFSIMTPSTHIETHRSRYPL